MNLGIRFSKQPVDRLSSMRTEAYQWMLFDDLITLFNNYTHQMYFDHSYIFAVELGRELDLNCSSHIIALDRIPENGCEIQDMASVVNGVLIRLKIARRQTSKQDTTMVKALVVTMF